MPTSDTTPAESDRVHDRVADLVRSLAAVMRQSEVTELDVDVGNVSIRLRRPTQGSVGPIEDDTDVAAFDLSSSVESGHLVTAPMVGTFYTSPTPSASPFVAIGDDVHAGQTIGIIEAMKIMNEITADQSGVVQEMLVLNGQPVEYGSPLFRLSQQSRRT